MNDRLNEMRLLKMLETVEALRAAEAKLELLEMVKDAWRSYEEQTVNQCIWDVQAILDGEPPQALEAIKGDKP